VAQLRAAITLAAARPGADAPSEEFVADLQRRLAAGSASAPAPTAAIVGPARRRFVLVGSVAAGAAAIGAVADHLLTRPERASEDEAAAAPTLTPNVGAWRGVVAAADLPEGGVHGFELGSVAGFVSRDSSGLRAVSGVCTHLACRLNLNPVSRQLDCPCHDTSFALDGELIRYQLRVPPPPLPHLSVRERDGTIEVFGPL